MIGTVHILATCRKPELLPCTLLVFDTLRVGFPTAEIVVTGNNLSGAPLQAVLEAGKQSRCSFVDGPQTIHHQWITSLLNASLPPFAIVDTDMIFYESVEGWTFERSMAGWRVPEWNDTFTGARTRARLHTSFLFLDPDGIRHDVAKFKEKFPDTAFNPCADLVFPLCVPFKGGAYFYDTMSMMYQAIGGQSFTDEQLDAYHHMNFGTISDIVLPRLPDREQMQAARAAVLANPELGRGAWRAQMAYYEARQ